MTDDQLNHFNQRGEAHMVDVGDKPATKRIAIAAGIIRMQPATLELLLSDKNKKGDALATARIAGIMAAKRTADLVPLCHPISLSHVSVDLEPDADLPGIEVIARAETSGPTGVEMEALAATQVALLTIYDMCKAVDRGMTIDNVRLIEKHGGKSGVWIREGESSYLSV